jgi:hypothetical protein
MTKSTTVIKKFSPPRQAKNVEHAVVYRRDDEFASHPYVRGFWATAAGHLICNFSVATVDYRGDPNLLAHPGLLRNHGGRRSATVRSEDRGRTWQLSNADRNRPNNDVMVPRPGIDGQPPGSLADIGPIDYTNKDVLISNFNHMYMKEDPLLTDFYASVTPSFGPPENQVYIRVSKDGGRNWSRSVMLPLDGLQALSAVESNTIRPDGRCLLFLVGSSKGSPGRPLVYRSIDDGTDFHFLSYVTPKDEPLAGGRGWMYPRGVMLSSGRILCVLRTERDWAGDMWTELYKSDDGGQTWQWLSRVTDFGAPSAPVVMRDGRLVMVYTYRLAPAGMRAVVSEDDGETWGPEIIVRGDGGSWDLGYPRAWEAEPGKIGVIYYFNDKDDPMQVHPVGTLWGAGGVRYIARSFFSVD